MNKYTKRYSKNYKQNKTLRQGGSGTPQYYQIAQFLQLFSVN